MKYRVNKYFQLPASPALIKHIRQDIGLTGEYLKIFDDLRAVIGDTQLHADNVGMAVKQYNAAFGIVGQTCVWELIRLAEIGLKAEQNE